jgi:hypothetical protein
MPRTKKSTSRVEKAKEIPWGLLLQGSLVVGRRWRNLSAKERERFKQLLAESHGRIDSLSDKQRKELKKLARKLDLKGMSRELLALRVIARKRRRRRGA